MIIIADIFSGMVIEALHLAKGSAELDQNISVGLGIVTPLTIYVAAASLSLIHTICNDCCICKKQTDDCCTCKYTYKCTCTRQTVWLDILKIIAKLCTIVGSVLYFIGDNLPKEFPEMIPKNVTAVILVFGVLFYRVLPTTLKRLENYCMVKRQNRKNGFFDVLIPNKYETHSLVVAITNSLTITIDFDIWLTIIINSTTETFCLGKYWKPLIFCVFGALIALFMLIQIETIVIFLCHDLKKGRSSLRRPWKKRARICDTTCGVIISVITVLAIGAFLLVDNKHMLDCTGIEELTPVGENKEESKKYSKVRLGVLLISFILFLGVIISFLCRKICGCVQYKGRLTSVNVSRHHLQVNFKEGKDNVKVLYPLSSSTEVTGTQICNKLSAIYEEHIKHIVKYLGFIGKLVAVNVQTDNITVVREIGGKIWVVEHYITKNNDKQYKVYEEIPHEETTCTRTITPLRSDELLAMNGEENGEICAVYRRKYQNRQYVFRTRRSTRQHATYGSINVQSGAEHHVSVLSEDQSDMKHAKYDPEKGEIVIDHENYQPLDDFSSSITY